MIILCGIPSESPLAMVAAELEALGYPYRIFNQRKVGSCDMSWQLDDGAVDGQLQLEGEVYRLSDIQALYLRLMDDRLLPELQQQPEGAPARRHARAFHEALLRWSEVAPARVVNRAEPQGSNSSKAYQAQLIAKYGFSIPETLITNDPERVHEFRRRRGPLVYKSISGIRSIVKLLDEEDLARLEQIRWCPVQFQVFVAGTNIRVHTIGDEVFATEIDCDVTDYRYARMQGSAAKLRAVKLPDRVNERCLAMAEGLGLAFAGIDLKVTPEGEVFCFEINPSPAFSYFEANTGQPIARALARSLTSGSRIQ